MSAPAEESGPAGTAAAFLAGPGRAREAARFLAVAAWRAFGSVLNCLERDEHLVAQGLEPALRSLLVRLERAHRRVGRS